MNANNSAAQPTDATTAGVFPGLSPLPWRLNSATQGPYAHSLFSALLEDASGKVLGEFYGRDRESCLANGRFAIAAANERSELIEALNLLLYGAKQCQARGVVQPQLNGGVVMAEAILARVQKPTA